MHACADARFCSALLSFSLFSLDLSHHGLRNSGLSALCDVLPQCRLRYVNLQRNHIGNRGANALARSGYTERKESGVAICVKCEANAHSFFFLLCFACLLSCLQSLLSSSSSPWFDPSSSHSAFLFDLSFNAMDTRAQAALHAAMQQATMLARGCQTQQQQQQRQTQGADPLQSPRGGADASRGGAAAIPQASSIFRCDIPSSAASIAAHTSAAADRSSTSASSSCSLWVWPSLRAPAYAQPVRPHLARLLQQAACVASPAVAMHIECGQQTLPSDDSRPDPAALWLAHE